MKSNKSFLPYCDKYTSEMASHMRKKKSRAGHDFVQWELIGSLLRSHVSDRRGEVIVLVMLL